MTSPATPAASSVFAVSVTCLAAVLVAIGFPVAPAHAALALPSLPALAAPTALPASGAAAADVAAIRAAQDAVIQVNHRPAITSANRSVSGAQSSLHADEYELSYYQSQASTARAAQASAAAKLSSDRSSLGAAAAANRVAQANLAADRVRLRAIALAMYTGALDTSLPSTVQALEADQQQVIDNDEVTLVASIVDKNLKADIATARVDANTYARWVLTVSGDQQSLDGDITEAAKAGSQAAAAAATVSDDQRKLAGAESTLADAEAARQAALTAVAGPAALASQGLSVVGTSALDAQEMVAWFNSQGYFDLTNYGISRLAAWYLQAGEAEGIRGDVAFAQAVLETGGFSSSDAIELNNYAGIGHCDSCSQGWTFPSGQGGVVGQEQLLRIFAARGSPAGAPAPVLPALTPSKQFESGCCQTWESLTGVWATDPLYGSQILAIYQDMLGYASSQPTISAASSGSG